MSFTDAIGQVDQIVQWEQQLASGAPFNGSASATTAANAAGTGASATGGSSTASSTGTGTSGTSTAAATFAAALAQAQSSDNSSLLGSATAGLTTGTASTDPTAAGSSGLLSSGDSQLLAALTSLEAGSANSTTTPTASAPTAGITGITGITTGSATSPADPRVQAMLQEANSLIGQPYVWGGGHGSWGPQSGYDCSGFVSAVLHAGGYLQSPQDTTSLPSAPGIASGPGQYVTIYDRSAPGEAGHVIIDIAGQFYESGGEHGSWGGGGGVQEIATPPASYLATFDTVLHPQGL